MSNGLRSFVSMDPGRITIEHEDLYAEERKIQKLRSDITAEVQRIKDKEMAAERERVNQLWAALEKSFDKFIDQTEAEIKSQMIELSIRVAEIIIRRKLPDVEMISSIIRETLEPMSDMQGARVRMSPEDAAIIQKAREGGGVQSLSPYIQIVADGALKTGDLVMESRNGYFDARIGERLSLLAERLTELNKNKNENNT